MAVPVFEDRSDVAHVPSHELAETVARRLSALAEPTRLKLALELRERDDASVQELAAVLGLSMPNASKHLQVLHQAGIVTRHKQGTYVRYRIASRHVGALVHFAVRILGNTRRR